jgi:retinol dehydrogenase-12
MGLIQSLYTQTFPPAATWGVDSIPDLSGRVAVVTGGYAGIGTETVKVSPSRSQILRPSLSEVIYRHSSIIMPKSISPEETRAKPVRPSLLSSLRLAKRHSSSSWIWGTSSLSRLLRKSSRQKNELCISYSTMRKSCLLGTCEQKLTLVSRGVMNPPVENITSDGYDQQWGTNVLG